jgi:hypothetical protein
MKKHFYILSNDQFKYNGTKYMTQITLETGRITPWNLHRWENVIYK